MKDWIYKTRYVKGLIEEKRASVVWQEEEQIKKQVLVELKKILICITGLFVIVLLYIVTYTPHPSQIYETLEKQTEKGEYSIDYCIGDCLTQGSTHIVIPEKAKTQQTCKIGF